MNKITISIFLASFLVLAGCNYYRSDWQPAKMLKAEKSILLITTIGQIKGNKKPFIMKGITLSLGDGLYLALTHLSKIPTKRYYRSFLGIVSVKRTILSEKFYINNRQVKLVGRYKDISLFRGKAVERYPFIFGNSDNVVIGTKIWVAGYSFLYDKIVKDGIIASTNVRNQHSMLLNKLSDMFEITSPINPGDSGSPLFAEHNGSYEIIGIVDAMREGAYGMGYAIKINIVKKDIQNILNTEKYMQSGDE